MLRQLRLIAFHLVEFVKVPYFISLMVMSTLSILVVQALAFYAWGGDPWVAWVRSGIVGMWTTTTVAAGILGFERFKGTFVHLVTARINVLQPLAAVVSASSLFGVLAFAVAWVSWGLIWIGSDVGYGHSPLSLGAVALLIVLLWVACLVISFVIATLFVLTPNAIAYEGLLLIPIFIPSGLLFTTTHEPAILQFFGHLIPISGPSKLLLGALPAEDFFWVIAETIGVCACWLALAYFMTKVALRRARVDGTLEVV